MKTQIKINWNKDSKKNARYAISDGESTHYVSESQLDLGNNEILGMRAAAEAFTIGYDHGGSPSTYARGWIEDLEDGERHKFAFDRRGNFDWDTR